MGALWSGVLDRMAASDVFDQLRDIPAQTVHRGFERLHAGVGTSDLTDEAASFWFLDTLEILRFCAMMAVYAFVYTVQLWSYLAHMRITYVDPPAEASPWNISQPLKTLAVVHVGSVSCGWFMWLSVSFLVAYRAWCDIQANSSNDSTAMPKLVRRVAPSVWAPVDKKVGIWRHPIHDTRPQPFRFLAPILGVHDGEVLLAFEELIDDTIFGDKVVKAVRKERKKWQLRLQRWYPPTVKDGFQWCLSRRAITEDYSGNISKPRLKPGRYFVDYDEDPADDEPMRSKDLRRILWGMLWLPAGAAAACETLRNWDMDVPQSSIGWLSFLFSLLSAMSILWFQLSTWGAKKAESWDRSSTDTDNVFSGAARFS